MELFSNQREMKEYNVLKMFEEFRTEKGRTQRGKGNSQRPQRQNISACNFLSFHYHSFISGIASVCQHENV